MHPHQVLRVKVAYALVKLKVVEIRQALPIPHPIPVQAVQHLAFALPKYQLLLIHNFSLLIVIKFRTLTPWKI